MPAGVWKKVPLSNSSPSTSGPPWKPLGNWLERPPPKRYLTASSINSASGNTPPLFSLPPLRGKVRMGGKMFHVKHTGLMFIFFIFQDPLNLVSRLRFRIFEL